MLAPYIRMSNLTKTYQMGLEKINALAGITLDIEQGSFCLMIGPSGSGKSTFLYLLGGLDRPTNGTIFVENESLDDLDENQLAAYRRRKVGFIFQSFNLIPSINAWENVAYPLYFSGVPFRERKSRALVLLDQIQMGDRSEHKPHELSGGQQQRVAIARALINNPHIILADEPTGNLDSASGESVMNVLADLHLDGTTIVVVSHDPRMVNYASRVLHILDGCIQTIS